MALTETGSSPIYAQAVEAIASYVPVHGTDIENYGTLPSYTAPANLVIQNNIVEDFSYQGIDLGWDSNATPTAGNTIAQNLFQNIGAYNDQGVAVRLYNNFYADVVHNTMQNVRVGVQVNNFSLAPPRVARRGASNTTRSAPVAAASSIT